jgi:hypothetical protein
VVVVLFVVVLGISGTPGVVTEVVDVVVLGIPGTPGVVVTEVVEMQTPSTQSSPGQYST